jgi:two-component system response regulator VicR
MTDETATILCIEDEPDMIELIRLILRQHNYNVIGALGGEEGVRIAEETRPDLVLLDLMMPGLDGWAVYQRFRSSEKLRETPVIIVTAKAQKIDKVLGLHIAKVDDYISKPFGPQELISSIQRVLSETQSESDTDQQL